jgi:hypothetical protein
MSKIPEEIIQSASPAPTPQEQETTPTIEIEEQGSVQSVPEKLEPEQKQSSEEPTPEVITPVTEKKELPPVPEQGTDEEASKQSSSEQDPTKKTKTTTIPVKKRKKLFHKDKNKTAKYSYAHDVYKRRFKNFRRLRLLSWLVGASIFIILVMGMFQLYNLVFSTIEDTEHLFLITEKRRTHTIDFQALEDVRASWEEKHTTTSIYFTNQLFEEPIPKEEITTEKENE